MNTGNKHFRIQKDPRTRSVRALNESNRAPDDGVPLFPAHRTDGKNDTAERLKNLEDRNRTMEEKKDYARRKYKDLLRRVCFSPLDNHL
jgi:hypothetical protein